MTTLNEKDFRNFWIRLHLGATTDLHNACIDRAYRDFNRTMHGMAKRRTTEKYAALKSFMREVLTEILALQINHQNQYDQWHKEKCDGLKCQFQELMDYHINYGQAQKWINMSLKYLFALSEDHSLSLSSNCVYFHIPIDNIMQDKLIEKGIPRLTIRWSRLDNYDIYLDYQKMVRQTFKGQIPMDVEFRMFNE